jgi:hypothetical protein
MEALLCVHRKVLLDLALAHVGAVIKDGSEVIAEVLGHSVRLGDLLAAL